MKVSMSQRRQIRRMIRHTLLEQKLLAEQRTLMLEKIDRVNYELSAQGYNPRMIEEGIMDILGGGMVSAFKSQAVEYIADAIGINKESIVYRFLMNFVEEFNILGMGKYFEKGKCKEIPALVAKAATETIAELQGRRLIELIYFAMTGEEKISSPDLLKRLDTALGGLVAAAGREIINETIYSFVGPMIEPKIEAIFCKYNGLKDFLYRGVYKGEAGEDLKDIAKGSALAGAAGIAADSAMDSGDEALRKRDDERRRGSGADLAKQIMGNA